MPTFAACLRSLRLHAAVAAAITAVALLVTGCSGGDGGSPRACLTVRSATGDLVPRGAARPCIVYGSDWRPAAGGGADQPIAPAGPGGSKPAKPKAPAPLKQPSVPKVPAAPKAPSFVKR